MERINPATAQIQNFVPDSNLNDVEIATNAARDAYPDWRDLHFSETAVYLRKIAAEMSKPDVHESLAIAHTNDVVCILFYTYQINYILFSKHNALKLISMIN